MNKKIRPLTSKQQRFCEEYQIDLNATQAAIRAGYCANAVNRDYNCGSVGTENLHKIAIKNEIARLKVAKSIEIGLTAQYILDKLKKIAEATEKSNPSVSIRAFELLGKHKGIFELDNAQKVTDVRSFTRTQLLVVLADDEAKCKEIDGITGGIAGESIVGHTGGL